MAKSTAKKIKKRNPLHDHPLLRKSSVHSKTQKQKRGNEKVQWKRECLDQNVINECVLMNTFTSAMSGKGLNQYQHYVVNLIEIVYGCLAVKVRYAFPAHSR